MTNFIDDKLNFCIRQIQGRLDSAKANLAGFCKDLNEDAATAMHWGLGSALAAAAWLKVAPQVIDIANGTKSLEKVADFATERALLRLRHSSTSNPMALAEADVWAEVAVDLRTAVIRDS